MLNRLTIHETYFHFFTGSVFTNTCVEFTHRKILPRMKERCTESWNWVWPNVGAIPIHQGLDSEMFDRTDYPFSATLVREAIQNSLDARLDKAKPVLLRFTFHKENIGKRHALLSEVISHRERAQLHVPSEWINGRISWLLVEDFNSKGLSGDLANRTGDFWNYWLNFGLSNKKGEGRGGRGFGRVTFLIASQIRTVIGYTKRDDDKETAVCGMTVLRAQKEGKHLKSTDAYLAKGEKGDVYDLHNTPEFHAYVRESLAFQGYDGTYQSGLGLAILYPFHELNADIIFAAAIENFAPAIMDDTLKLIVNDTTLDSASIMDIASEHEDQFKDEAIKSNIRRFLNLVRQANDKPPIHTINLPTAQKSHFETLRTTTEIADLQSRIVDDGDIVLEICFPLKRSGNTTLVSIRAVIGPSLSERRPIDRLFREGMSLPLVTARTPSSLDLVLLVRKGQLATYLNFCEGKAHLDLLESKEVLQTLSERGFDGHQVKRLVKSLPDELRSLLTQDVTTPDSQVFDRYFSMPVSKQNKKKGHEERDEPIEPIPPPNPPVFLVDTLQNGLRIYANPDFSGWPMNVTVRLAYADGNRRPTWSPFDFKFEELLISSENCEISTENDKLRAQNCGAKTVIEVTGFDTNRELDSIIRPWSDA